MSQDSRKEVPVLEVRSLRKIYDENSPTLRTQVIDDLSLTVKTGQFVCILGPSGCGKSTLLRCVAGFEDYQGEVLVNGKLVMKPGAERIMVFQDFSQLFPWMTVEKNLQYPLKHQGIRDRKVLEEMTEQYLGMVGLLDYRKYYPHQLSGGMKQRVAIARTMAQKPTLVLMDEPMASLDAMSRNNLQDEILKIHQEEHLSVIFITHNIQEAICLGDRILVMADGGKILLDMDNPLPKPVKPSSKNYGEVWDELHAVLYQARR